MIKVYDERFSDEDILAYATDLAEWHAFVRRREFELLMKRVGKDLPFTRGLELGAGDGGQSVTIAKYCRQLTCTEMDESGNILIGKFKAREIPNVEYRLCDARDLSQFADGSFDFIFSSNMLEHVVGHEKCLFECHRVLAKDGRMIHTMPTRTWKFWNGVVSIALKRQRPQLHGVESSHWREWVAFGANNWIRRINMCGFKVSAIGQLPFYFGHGPNPLWLLKLGNRLGWNGTIAYHAEKA